MTKFTATALLAIPLLTTACVSYDDPDDRDSSTYDEFDDELEHRFSFAPSQAEVGETFIGYLMLDDGDLDLEMITDLQFQGDVQIISTDIRTNEIVVSLMVPEIAAEGDVDLLVIIDDQDAIWLDAALTLYPAESGMSAAEYDPEAADDDCP